MTNAQGRDVEDVLLELKEIFPNLTIDEDNGGQTVIYTDMRIITQEDAGFVPAGMGMFVDLDLEVIT